MSTFDHRKPAETGKSGKITFPDTRKRTIVVEPNEYAPATGNIGLRTKPDGTIDVFAVEDGVQAVKEASEFSVHPFFEPVNPTGISATATSSTTIDIAATIDEAGNDGVEIHMSTTQGSGYTLQATVEESAFPVEISGLTASTTYYFVLRSFLWDGVKKDAAFTAEVSATTGAGGAAPAESPSPTISEVSRTATTMTLEATWSDVGDETSYEWWAGSDNTVWSNGSQSAANEEPENTTSVQYTATRANADDGTFFCLRACNASGCASHKCDGFTVAGNLTAPTNLAATNPSGSDVDVDWTDMAGASVADLTAIERRLVGGTFAEIATVAFGTTHYDDNGLADGNYEYRGRHRDNDTGNNSPYSATNGVTVGVGGGGGSEHPNEPAGLTQIAGIDFTNGFTAQVGEAKHFGGANSTTVTGDGTTPSGDGAVVRMTFPDGEVDGSANGRRWDLWGPTLAQGSGANDYAEVYVSYRMKIEGSDYQNQTNGTKVFYVAYGSTNRSNHSYEQLVGAGSQSIMSSMTLRKKISQMNADGSDPGGGATNFNPNLTDEKFVVANGWHHIEAWYKINDISPTQDNGEYKQWINGVQTHHYTGIRWRSTENPKGFYHLQVTPVYGGNSGDVRTRDDFWRIDELYISKKD